MPSFQNRTPLGTVRRLLNDGGVRKNAFNPGRSPTPADDIGAGYEVGSMWVQGDSWWLCVSNAQGAARWLDGRGRATTDLLEAASSAAASAQLAANAAAQAADRLAQISAVIAANIPEHDWQGTSLRLRNPDGEFGDAVDLKGDKGDKGDQGDSAFAAAQAEGFTGTRAEWLAALEGDKGDAGDKGEAGDSMTVLAFEFADTAGYEAARAANAANPLVLVVRYAAS